jgi:hypothetical protein
VASARRFDRLEDADINNVGGWSRRADPVERRTALPYQTIERRDSPDEARSVRLSCDLMPRAFGIKPRRQLLFREVFQCISENFF